MKKIFVALLIVFVCGFSFAANAKSRFGVKGGFNASFVTHSADAFTDISGEGTKYKPGFHAGMIIQYDLGSNIFLQPEFLFSNQGVKGNERSWEEKNKTTNVNVNYIQLPVYVGYKMRVGSDLDAILGVGPYLSYMAYITDWYDDRVKDFDFGGSVLAGIQYQKFQIALSYDFGFIDISKDDRSWGRAKSSNRNAKVSVVYFF